MPGITFNQLRGAPPVLSTHRFRLDLGPIPTTSLIQSSGGLTYNAAIAIFCVQATLVGGMVEPMEVNSQGHTVIQRGRATNSHVAQFAFLEARGGIMQSLLKGWKEMTVGTITGYGLSRDQYKVDAMLTTFDEQDQPAIVQRIYGLLPQDISDIQLDGQGGAQPMLVNFTAGYDISEMPGLYAVDGSPLGRGLFS